MTGSLPKLSDDAEFIGYPFAGPPPLQSRLWFLERQLDPLLIYGQYTVIWEEGTGALCGRWTVDAREAVTPILAEDIPMWDERRTELLAGVCLRWEGEDGAFTVWRLTDLTIPHITTFGRDDDIWRLGLWPD